MAALKTVSTFRSTLSRIIRALGKEDLMQLLQIEISQSHACKFNVDATSLHLIFCT
jgi:hypothetical protein